MAWFLLACGGASFIDIIVCTPTRRGLTFVRAKVSKTRLGLCPKTPVAGCAGYGLIYGGSRKSIRTAHRIAPKVAAAHLPFPPTPFPVAGKGPGWADEIRAAVRRLGYVRACREPSRRPMVMVSGAGGLQEKGGRSPPPKRGRPGGGRCAAAPYKHRLAHAPGRRSRSGRAFRCVGFLGRSPKSLLGTFGESKVPPRR